MFNQKTVQDVHGGTYPLWKLAINLKGNVTGGF